VSEETLLRRQTSAPGSTPGERARWDQATLDASGDGYIVLQAVRNGDGITDWIIVVANQLVRDRWAWVVDDVVGIPTSQLNAAADNSAFLQIYAAAVETGKQQVHDVQLTLPGARGGWWRLIVTPVGPDTVSVITRDISRERQQPALAASSEATPRPDSDDAETTRTASEIRFTSRSASALLVGAGAVSIANSILTRLNGVNLTALRVTGACSTFLAIIAALLPWERYYDWVTSGLTAVVLALLLASDHFNHYSRVSGALAIYPVLFLVLVAWVGMTRDPGAATIVAILSAPALYEILASGGHASVGWQCIIVVMPVAAVLGEVLSWNARRVRVMAARERRRHLIDPLTGLANRVMLSMRMEQALARARRGLGSVAVLYLDLDHFKGINDTLGHTAGDEVLVATAASLQASARTTDTVARIGGDEFVVLCEDIQTVTDAAEIAQRLVAVGGSIESGAGSVTLPTFSIGMAYSEFGSESVDTMLQNADLALYRAKQEGRARVEVFGESLRHDVAFRRDLEQALRTAITRNELEVHFQPIVTTEDCTVVGFEALVRWQRPGYGLVLPGDFIPVAEESGIILDVGSWVLRHACQQAGQWQKLWPHLALGVSVNVTGYQLRQPDFVDLVRHALESTALPPDRLTLELTETMLIDDSENTRPLLDALGQLGVRIALDDFGTGYSSLTYLRRLPIDTVKIDRSFVHALGTSTEDSAIVTAVIQLARDLHLGVVAEGVETPVQLEALRALGCSHAQGYLFAKPTPAEHLAELLGSQVELPR